MKAAVSSLLSLGAVSVGPCLTVASATEWRLLGLSSFRPLWRVLVPKSGPLGSHCACPAGVEPRGFEVLGALC